MMSVDQHKALAKELCRLRKQLFTFVTRDFGMTKRQWQRLRAIETKISEASSKFDDDFAQQHPKEFDVTTYYPGPKKP